MEAGAPRSPKYLLPRSRNKINVFKVRVCAQDGQRVPAERAEDRARSEWSLGRWGSGWNGCVDAGGWMRSLETRGGEPMGRERRGASHRRPPPRRVQRPCARVPRRRRRRPDSPAAAPPAERGPACSRAAAGPPPPEQLEPVSVPFRSPPHHRRSCSNGVENGHWAAVSYRLSAPRFVLSCL